jgi:hypothetical protein
VSRYGKTPMNDEFAVFAASLKTSEVYRRSN